jgi:YHS domain-containing protein
MRKLLLVALLGVGFASLAYAAGIAKDVCPMGADCSMMSAAKPVAATAPSTAPSTAPAAKIDVGNTKCIVRGEDAGSDTVEYQGKLYHICCSSCVGAFNKNPEKYVKALEADPAKFGVKN